MLYFSLLPLISYLDVNKHSKIVEYIDWILSEFSVGVHNMLNRIVRTCISLLQWNTSVFMHFVRSVGYSTVWCLVQVAWRYKDDKCFSCTFSFFEKATNIFTAAGHHACSPTPTKISIDILLTAAKTFGLKIIVAFFTKTISIHFYCWWLQDVSFQSPLDGPCLHTQTELYKGLILKPEPDPSPKSQAQTRLQPHIYFWSPI